MSQFNSGNNGLGNMGLGNMGLSEALGSTQGLGHSGLGQAGIIGAAGATSLNNLGAGLGNQGIGGQMVADELTTRLMGDDRINIVKGVFMLAPGVKAAVARPHTLDTSSSNSVNAVNLLGNLLADQGTLPESKLRQLGAQIVTCAVDHEGVVAIPNGWESKRLRFLLVFEVKTVAVRYYEILTGYTDFDNPTVGLGGQDGNVDPNMRLFFNNVMRMKPTQVKNQFGAITEQLTLMSTHQVMTMRDGNAAFDITGLGRPTPKEMITPTSLFQRMEVNSSMMNGFGSGVLDTRTRVGVGGGITMANRANTLGSNFFTNTLKGARNALTELQTSSLGGANMQRRQIYGTASNHTLVSETNAIEDKVLSRIRENSDFATRGSITWSRFSEIFPEADTICEVVRHADLQESYTFHAQDTFNLQSAGLDNSESWDSAHLATVKAQQLLTSIPALMTDCLISNITFSATNMTLGRALDPFEFKPTHAASYLGDGVNINPLIDLFMAEFRNRIHPVLSNNDELHYTFTMHCDVLGEMRMTIYYDGMPHQYNYTAGAYCDHLFTPVLSGKADRLNNLAQDFDGLLSNVLKF